MTMLHNIIIVLTISSLAFTFALPSKRLDASFLVCGYKPVAEVGKPHCMALLDDLISKSWVHEPITFGRTQSEPGTIPFHTSTDTCELAIRAIQAKTTASETFRLIDYFAPIWEINARCLIPESRHNMGTTPVGAEGLFYVYLGARWPALSESARNETAGA